MQCRTYLKWLAGSSRSALTALVAGSALAFVGCDVDQSADDGIDVDPAEVEVDADEGVDVNEGVIEETSEELDGDDA